MKKITSVLLVAVMVLGMFCMPVMAENEIVRIYLFDEELIFDVPAQIINGRTMVPARTISEASGYKVDWGEATRSVFITKPVQIHAPFEELKNKFMSEGKYSEETNIYSKKGAYNQSLITIGFDANNGVIIVAITEFWENNSMSMFN